MSPSSVARRPSTSQACGPRRRDFGVANTVSRPRFLVLGTSERLRLRLAGGIAAVAAGLVGAGLWLAPPPPAPVSFQDEVRQHLVQMSNPLSDQTSYVVEARYP